MSHNQDLIFKTVFAIIALILSTKSCDATVQDLLTIFPSTLTSLDSKGIKGAHFESSTIPTYSPENVWKPVPPQLVGKWGQGKQFRIYRKDFKTGQVDSNRIEIYSPQKPLLASGALEQTFEFAGQQDKVGRTWLFVGVPLVRSITFEPGITAYNCLIENKVFDVPNTDFAVRQRIYTTWVGNKSQQILLANRDLSCREFKMLPNNQLLVLESTRSYDQSGLPLSDEVHETVLNRVSLDSHSSIVKANNLLNSSTDELFKQFQKTLK